MERAWTTLKTFAQTRPVLYGAPTAAVLGVMLGLMFRIGPQVAETPTMEPFSSASIEDAANPIAWPSGKTPDYVVGTDFLASTRIPDPVYVADTGYYEPVAEREPPPAPVTEPPPMVIAARAAHDEPRWASTRGDILDIRLPEDPPPLPIPQP